MTIVALIIRIIFAVWCYCVAKDEQRNPIIAAILAFIFGLFAVIGYYIAGDKYEERYDE